MNTQWLFWRNKINYLSVGQIVICLVQLSLDKWLLTTIKKVIKYFAIYEGINYEGDELTKYKKYFGRVIISYHKEHQPTCMYYETIADKLVIEQLLPSIYDG
ncbi:hypothetical protein [Selenomonas sp. AE3005]|uniref:hypothetical protein n=1 Tax=Selenomonas sp. AE3005 TaxID=1485543 RepID=UPI00068DCAAA|nr:hypothetical protein [Selenomonas sp. AE3005]